MGLFDIFQNKPKNYSDSDKSTLIVFDWDSFRHQQDLSFIEEFTNPVILFISREEADPKWELIKKKYPSFEYRLPEYERSFSHYFICVLLYEFFNNNIYKKVVIAASHNYYKGVIAFLNEKKILAEIYEVEPTAEQLARRALRTQQRTQSTTRNNKKNQDTVKSSQNRRSESNSLDSNTRNNYSKYKTNSNDDTETHSNSFQIRNSARNKDSNLNIERNFESEEKNNFNDSTSQKRLRNQDRRGYNSNSDRYSSNFESKSNFNDSSNNESNGNNENLNRKFNNQRFSDNTDRNEKPVWKNNHNISDDNYKKSDINDKNQRVVHYSNTDYSSVNDQFDSGESSDDKFEKLIPNNQLSQQDLDAMVSYFNHNFEVGEVYLNSRLGMLIKQATNKSTKEVLGALNAKPFIRSLLKNGCIEPVDNQNFRVLNEINEQMIIHPDHAPDYNENTYRRRTNNFRRNYNRNNRNSS